MFSGEALAYEGDHGRRSMAFRSVRAEMFAINLNIIPPFIWNLVFRKYGF